ncbi:ATP-binding cassette domain-containing protein [bacterium]|nr:ATP-binding cassette domain-containing protein [bacterium]
MTEHQCIIETRNLSVFHFSGAVLTKKHYVVKNFTMHIHHGEIIGLSGESGCGKSTLGKSILNLIPTWEGDIYWNGINIRNNDLRPYRRNYGWMSQEPFLIFNPRRKIIDSLAETLLVHHMAYTTDETITVLEPFLRNMSLDKNLLSRYPFELSGGQIQRLSLLRVLSLQPRFVVLDEPTSSLDPISQKQIVELIMHYHSVFNMGILWISHSVRFLEKNAHTIHRLD